MNGHPFDDLVMTRTIAGRWGEPEDVHNAALFLASKASDFVNGHVLHVDGGILANFGYVKGERNLNMGKVITFRRSHAAPGNPGFERFGQSGNLSATYGGEANVAVSLANYGIATKLRHPLAKK